MYDDGELLGAGATAGVCECVCVCVCDEVRRGVRVCEGGCVRE